MVNIDRINELARKSRTAEGLTEEEKEEQKRLRREYIDAYKSNLSSQLDHLTIVKPDGTAHKVKLKDEPKH